MRRLSSNLRQAALLGLLVLALLAMLALIALWIVRTPWGTRFQGSGTQDVGYQPVYLAAPEAPTARLPHVIIGIHPLHNPNRLFEVYGPLIDLLNARIPTVRFELEASRNYDEYDRKLYARRYGFALPNPYEIVMSIGRGYRVIAKADNDEQFRGLIIVRRDSSITQPADLRGKAVSFPAPTALAATMMPQQFLRDHGGLGQDDYRVRYVGSQESSIMNVVLGTTEAGGTWPPPWIAFQKRQPAEAARLRLIWSTDPLPSIGWVARNDLDPQLVEQVRRLLVGLQAHPQDHKLLEPMGLPGFVTADNDTYRPVHDFLTRFNRSVRPIDTP